jgi:hypothetical protein
MVFSSIGDTTRSSSLQNAAHSGLLATRPLLRSSASGASTLARALFAAVFPAGCWLCPPYSKATAYRALDVEICGACDGQRGDAKNLREVTVARFLDNNVGQSLFQGDMSVAVNR